ncbi:fimbrial protein [Providencia stuartii]|uniref:fimbrial protein n=1 Tax=Providencia stuartii TaxID=588 RepID=UPI0018C50800|nr:fimbrial protein [Providencia stuartii]MBG5919301.1 fimbrial protein [Providencia stuartii]
MKQRDKLIRYFLTMSLLSCMVNHATAMVNIHYKGSIKYSTCGIKTQNINVDLGTWLTKSQNGFGSAQNTQSDWVEFTLDFECPDSMSLLNGQFQGASESSGKYLSLDKGNGYSTGAAIEIQSYENASHRWVNRNINTLYNFMKNEAVNKGNTSLKVRARYVQTNTKLTQGKANASVTFVVQAN